MAAESRTQRAVRTLGAAIVGGQHPPGTTLPTEAEICRQLGIGRNILREAVKVLAGKGLLVTQRRAGTTVLPRSRWNLLDADVLAWTLAEPDRRDEMLAELTQLRMMIEPEIAALAARVATPAEIRRLAEAYDAMERFRFDPQRAIEADIAFHERMFEASHHQLAGSLLRAFVVLLRANFALALRADQGFIRSLDEHRQVSDAVRRRDPEAACSAMRRLLANNEADLARITGDRAGRPCAEEAR